jgi:multimeric flavodoxin WrbA
MKILALQSSPRKHGNTVTLAHDLLDGLRASEAKDIHEVFLHGKEIQPCNNCDACLKKDGPFCVIDDDMQPLYQQFIDADLVVLATPIYWWSITAQLKLFIDRLYGLNFAEHPERFRGKKLALVFTHQEEHPCSGAEISRKMFDEIADYTEMKIVGDLRYSSEKGHVRDDPSKLKEARELGARLGKGD